MASASPMLAVIESKHIKLIGRLTTGGTSSIHIALLTNESILNIKDDIIVAKKYDEKYDKLALKEVKYLRLLYGHPNIVCLRGTVETKPPTILLEKTKGSLNDYLKELRESHQRLKNDLFYPWLRQIAKGIQWMHEHEVAHLDIKPSNILLTGERNILKLCDFGACEEIKKGKTKATNTKGTYRYMAPEIYTDNTFSLASDIFSYSIVVWELETCEIPFRNDEDSQIIWKVGRKGERPDIPDETSDRIRNLLEKCWKTQPSSRYCIDKILTRLDRCEVGTQAGGDPYNALHGYKYVTEEPQENTSDLAVGRLVKILPQLELVQEFGQFDTAWYIASSVNGLLALSDMDGRKCIIYHKQNEQFEMKLSVELNPSNTEGPWGVVLCPDGKVWLARLTGIEVYSPTGKYEKTISTKGSPGGDMVVCSLAITKDGSRILAGDFKRNVITVHDPTGSIIRTHKTSIMPCDMTVIQDTHVAISDCYPGKVSVMDMETGQETLNIYIPMADAICYEEHSDCILIGSIKRIEFHTGKIEQYCWRTGRLIACLAQGLWDPRGMTITPDGMLAVADEETVKIYKMT